jgi:large subunit ribosomal protein L10
VPPAHWEERVKRSEKGAVVDELRDLLTGARVTVLADHRGLSVAELTELRKLLGQQSVHLRVVKNTLARLATRGTELEALAPQFVGPTMIAFGTADPSVPAKLLASYAKTRPALHVKGGVVEGQVLAREEALALAELPSREVLLARLAGALRSPIHNAAVVLSGPVRALLAVLQGVIERRSKAEIQPQ